MSDLDALDTLAAEAFEGYLVRKDLAQQFKGQFPVPTYVGEFILGRYCATTDDDEIAAGLEVVQQSLQERTVPAGEQELFKHRARDQGRIRIIDLLRARLDAKSDAYKAELPSLGVNDIHISPEMVNEHQRMLTGGFYAEVTIEYIAALAQQQGGSPFRVEAIRPIQMSSSDALGTFIEHRSRFTLQQWRELLLRSVGFEPARLTQREEDVLIARMVPFVVRNYNAVELGPRGTGKSHLFQQVSPYAHLVSGGRATIANMFVNMNTGRRGLVAQYDVICFDEVSGVSFDQKEGVDILKGYMESGEFSRGRESIRADGGIVLVGNFDVDVATQLRIGHLMGPLPKEMRDDTAFMDRIHAYIPGWDVPKLDPTYFTRHFGFVSDFLAEVWSKLRLHSRLDVAMGRVEWGPALSGRDQKAVNLTLDGLLRLLYPDPEMEVPAEFLDWAASLALEMRRRVKEAQSFIGADEFGATDLSFSLDGGPGKVVYCAESVLHRSESAAGGSGRTATGSILPEPDPDAVKSRNKSRHYAVGEVINNRFEVRSELGRGGFATVYRVRDQVEGVERALKVFDDASGYNAVRRELEALRRIKHPNVREVIWADQTSEGEWYLVSEYIEGRLLADYTEGDERLRDREAVDVALDILSALIAMHPDAARLRDLEERKKLGTITEREQAELETITSNSLVHRDIKPHNIVCGRRGAMLLDFNISSRVGETVNTVAGTPAYLPPDLARTRWDVTPDLFGVAVTLYELVADGHHPYPNDEPMLDVQPIDPREFRSDLPAPLAAFLVRACAPRREQRFASAEQMAVALRAVRDEI